jgi:hypothetical protein
VQEVGHVFEALAHDAARAGLDARRRQHLFFVCRLLCLLVGWLVVAWGCTFVCLGRACACL